METNHTYKIIGAARTGRDSVLKHGDKIFVTRFLVTGYNTRIVFRTLVESEDYIDLRNEFYDSEPQDIIDRMFELSV